MRLSFGKNPPNSFSSVTRSNAAPLRLEVDGPGPVELGVALRPSDRRERARGESVLSMSTQVGELDLNGPSDSRLVFDGRVRLPGEDDSTDLFFSRALVENVFDNASVEGVCI